jgi:hypothetical protein
MNAHGLRILGMEEDSYSFSQNSLEVHGFRKKIKEDVLFLCLIAFIFIKKMGVFFGGGGEGLTPLTHSHLSPPILRVLSLGLNNIYKEWSFILSQYQPLFA